MSNEQATCFGCMLHSNFYQNIRQSQYDPPKLTSDTLTLEEKAILGELANAWNRYQALNPQNEHSKKEFQDAIHRCQQIIATRLASRINPEIWSQQ